MYGYLMKKFYNIYIVRLVSDKVLEQSIYRWLMKKFYNIYIVRLVFD